MAAPKALWNAAAKPRTVWYVAKLPLSLARRLGDLAGAQRVARTHHSDWRVCGSKVDMGDLSPPTPKNEEPQSFWETKLCATFC
jgi:hypothetical protein